MKIQTHCTHCQKEYNLDFELIGRKAKCSQCWEQFIIQEDTNSQPENTEKKVVEKSPDVEIKPNKMSFMVLHTWGIILFFVTLCAVFANIFIGGIFLLLTLVSYYFRFVTYKKSFFTITDRKIIYKTGTILTDNTVEVNLDKITLVKSRLGFIQNKLFKTGSLLVKTAGSSNSKVHFFHINETMEIYEELQNRMKKNGFHLQKDQLVQTAKPHALGVFWELGSKILSAGLVIIYFIWSAIGSLSILPGLDSLVTAAAVLIWVYIAIVIFFLTVSYLDLKRRKYEVFSDSIFYSEWFLTKNYAFIPMENISDTQNTQSFLSKVLWIHDVEISSGWASNKVVFKNMLWGEKMMESIKYLKDKTIMWTKDEIAWEVKKQSLINFKDKIEEPLDFDRNFTGEYKMDIARSMAGIMLMVLILSPLLFFSGETLFVIFIIIIPAIIKVAIAVIATKFQVTGSSVEYKYDFLTHKQNSFSVEKITKVTIIETLIDKLFKTCTIKFYSIGSGSAIVFKNIKKSDDLYEKLLAKVWIYTSQDYKSIPTKFNIIEYIKAHIFSSIFIAVLVIFGWILTMYHIAFAGLSLLILILFFWCIAYKKLFYSAKFYQNKLFKEFIQLNTWIFIQSREFALYRHIKSTHSTKNVATQVGNISLNVAGEQMQDTKSRKKIELSQIFTSNSIVLHYVVNVQSIVDSFDTIFLAEKVDSTELLSSKQDIKNTFVVTLPLIIIWFLFLGFSTNGIIVLSLFIIFALIFACIIWYIKTIKYSFQNHRVLFSSWIFYKKMLSIPYIRFNFIENDTGFVNKICKNGNVGIFTIWSGKKELNMKNISNYSQVYDLINKD